MTLLLQKVIHFGFDITGRLAPVTMGQLAFRLFATTPPRRPGSKKARDALERARPIMESATKMMLPVHGGRVATWYFPATGGEPSETVLVTHGWGARSEHMLDIITALQSEGRAVVALDLPGHGASSGRRLDMAKAVEAVDAAWRQYGPFSLMLGHSFGGAVVLNAAVGSVQGFVPRNPDRIVLISAPNALPAVFDWFADYLGLRPKSRQAMFDGVEEITGRAIESFIGTVQLARLKRPALIIHAAEDREVSADSARAYQTAGAHVELLWADGYGHRRILKAPEVIGAVRDFADRPIRAKAA